MKKNQYKAIIATSVYVVLCIAAYAFYLSRTATDKFAGMFIITLTAPWSTGFVFITTQVLNVDYELGFTGSNILLAISLLINATLIYWYVLRINR
jgi:hypothetical protein